MLKPFVKLADILKPVEVGSAKISIMDYTDGNISFREMMSGLQPERYAKLTVNGEVMMSETPMEQRTNLHFVNFAHGDILIGGLGIGMIILAIQDRDDVKSITVVENNQDVIDAVLPQLPINSKVTVVKGDVFTYKPDKKFDCIYMDIWLYPSTDVYPEMIRLKRRYGHYLKPLILSPKRFNECWAEYYARTGARLI